MYSFFIKNFDLNEIPHADTFRAISDNFSSENENTLIALLNILCRLVSQLKDFKDFLKKAAFAEFKTKIDTLKYHKNKSVQQLVEDVYFLLDK